MPYPDAVALQETSAECLLDSTRNSIGFVGNAHTKRETENEIVNKGEALPPFDSQPIVLSDPDLVDDTQWTLVTATVAAGLLDITTTGTATDANVTGLETGETYSFTCNSATVGTANISLGGGTPILILTGSGPGVTTVNIIAGAGTSMVIAGAAGNIDITAPLSIVKTS